MIQAGVGISSDRDPYQAGYEACSKAVKNANTEKPDLVIVFASVSLDQEKCIQGIKDASGGAPVVGCSDAGEITNEGPAQKSAAVMAIASDSITFTTGIGHDVKAGARAAGAVLASAVKERAPAPLRAFLMFPDVLTGNGADVVRGVQEVLGEHFPIVGGAAGDDFLFEKTYQYEGGEVATSAVAGVGLSGSFVMGVGVRHGWIPIGIPMKVTRSDGAVVHELNGRPAISIYEDYFGEKAGELKKEPLARLAITYPLGLKLPEFDEYLIRDPITVDEHGSITCAAEIPEGSEIRLMIGSREKAVEAAREAAEKLMRDFSERGSAPKLLLIFNCIAREKLYGQRAKDEIVAIQEVVGTNVPLLGFYTYGEQAPLGGEVRDAAKITSRFYNETIVMFALGEEA